MGMINFLRDKRWFINGFLFLMVILLLFGSLPSIYQLYKREGDTVIVEGRSFSKNKYNELLDHYKEFDNPAEQVSQKIRLEIQVEKILEAAGVDIDPQEVNNKLHEYAFMKELLPISTKEEIEGNNDPPKAYRDLLTTSKGKRYIKRPDVIKEVRKRLKLAKAITLLPSRGQKDLVKNDKEANIRYCRVPLEQIPLERTKGKTRKDDSAITESEKKSYLDKNKKLFSPERKVRIIYIRLPVVPSAEEIQTVEKEMIDIKTEFEKKKEQEIDKYNSDEKDSQKHRKTWEGNSIPRFLQDLKEGKVSPVINNGDRFTVYRVSKKSRKKIITYQITKKIESTKNKEHVEQRVDAIKKELTTKNIEELIEKYGYFKDVDKEESYTIDISKSMCGLQSNSLHGEIARKVFGEDLRRGEIFSIEQKDAKEKNTTKAFIIGSVLKRGKGDSLAYNKQAIEKGIKADKKLAKLNKELKSPQKKATSFKEGEKVLKKYIGLIWHKEKININKTKLAGEKHPAEIAKILLKEKGNFHLLLDKDKENIIVVYIEKMKKLGNPIIVKQATQDPEVYLKQYIASFKK